MRRIALLCACAACFAAPAFSASRLNPAEKRTMELEAAVVTVSVSYSVSANFVIGHEVLRFGPKKLGGWGTGFIYRPDGYIITNGHVVADAQRKDADTQKALRTRIVVAILTNIVIPAIQERNPNFRNFKLTSDNISELISAVKLNVNYSLPDITVVLANGHEYHGETKQYSDPIDLGGKDVAIIKIPANNLPTVKLGDSNNVRVQEPITVIGFPGAASNASISILSEASKMVPSVTNGHVSAVKSVVGQESVIQSDAVVGHGNSGGPAFNDANEVIGITTFKSVDESGFNFFVPINTAMEFVNAAGAKPETGLFNKLWADALDTYDAGKCRTAKPKLQSVLNILPNEPDVVRLMAASETCISEEGVIGGIMENSTWVIYGAAGVVLLAVAFFVLSKRKPAVAVAGGAPPVTSGYSGSAEQTRPGIPTAVAQPFISGYGGSAGPTRLEAPPAVAPPVGEKNFGSIQITAGALSGKRFNITKAGLLIGKDPAKCQIVVNEDTISHEHAWIVPVENSVVVIDRGSTNGTYINSVDSPRVSKVGLQNGDRVYLGKKGSVVLTYFSS